MLIKDNTIFCGGAGKVSQESLDKIEAFTKKTALHKAMDVLRMELNSDSGYYDTWKANIAMALYDELRDSKSGLPKICNDAADRFLQNLLLDTK